MNLFWFGLLWFGGAFIVSIGCGVGSGILFANWSKAEKFFRYGGVVPLGLSLAANVAAFSSIGSLATGLAGLLNLMREHQWHGLAVGIVTFLAVVLPIIMLLTNMVMAIGVMIILSCSRDDDGQIRLRNGCVLDRVNRYFWHYPYGKYYGDSVNLCNLSWKTWFALTLVMPKWILAKIFFLLWFLFTGDLPRGVSWEEGNEFTGFYVELGYAPLMPLALAALSGLILLQGARIIVQLEFQWNWVIFLASTAVAFVFFVIYVERVEKVPSWLGHIISDDMEKTRQHLRNTQASQAVAKTRDVFNQLLDAFASAKEKACPVVVASKKNDAA